MFNFHYKFLFIYIISLFFAFASFGNALQAQQIADIYSLEYPDDKVIYFGPFLQNETATMSFILKSYTTDSLFINEFAPTFIIETVTPGELYQDFFKQQNPFKFPILFNANKNTDTVRINFTALTDRSFGRKEARLIIGFLQSANPNPVYLDTFYIVGKSTPLYIDGYDDFVRFDSIFINQQKPINLTWKARNTNKNAPVLQSIAQSFELLSAPYKGNEFEVEQKEYPLQFHFSPDNNLYSEWNFFYNPKDTIKDTAEFRLLFQPEPGTNPLKIDTAKAKLYGIGVMQYFEILSHDAEKANEDTIDIGKISVGSSKTVNVTLRNRGNIRYKATKQAILHEIDDIESDIFQLTKQFCEGNQSLLNTDTASFEIKFFAKEKGEFFARYIIENDFEKRKIKSNNLSDYRKTFIIKGTGVAPQLRLMADTINFGNVNSANEISNCPIQKDTTITLFNTGNQALRISDISSSNMMFHPQTQAPFTIPQGESKSIVLTFSANTNPNLYTSDLIFSTNNPIIPKDTLTLIANAIPPISAVLSLPRLAAKPGTMLEMPITIKEISAASQAVTNYVSTFDITLAFNPTLLLYNNHITNNTASAGCMIEIDNNTQGQLRLRTNKLSTFQPSDTLLLLQFRTFLGNFRNTELSIASAKIGINDICDDYIKLTLEDGEYAIDSICGLDYKTTNGAGSFEYFLPANVANAELELSFTLPFDFPAKVEICNSIGDVIETHNFNLQKGKYKRFLSVTHYNTGTYYSVFSCGLYKKIVPFVKL